MKVAPVEKSDSILDFNLGYWMSLALAVCFVILGASFFYGSDAQLPQSGGQFATNLLSIFSQNLGNWAFPVVAIISLCIMYSTLITVLDGYARNVADVSEILLTKTNQFQYPLSVVLISIGAIAVLAAFMRSFATFIDLVGILVFVLGPIYALFNHRAVFGGEIHRPDQPSSVMKLWSWIGIIVLSAVATAYIALRWLV